MKLKKIALLGTAMLSGMAAATILNVALQTQAATPASDGPGSGPGDDGSSARGIITVRPEGTLYGMWTIGGVQYNAITGTTEFRSFERPLAVNQCAEVSYRPDGAGRTALRIRGSDDCRRGDGEDRGLIESKGQIESFPAELAGEWRVSGITYTAVTSTYFAQRERPFAVGGCVEIYHPVSSTVAFAIKSDDDCRGDREGFSRAKGILQEFPANITGTWTVNSVTYEVNAATLLNRKHGEFFVGGCVQVHYNMSDTVRTALHVATESLDDCGDRRPLTSTLRAAGIISSTPADGELFGTWNIGGQNYEAISGTTRFHMEHGAPEAGDCARVRYVMSGTLRIAQRIDSSSRHHCGRETEEARLFGAIKTLPANTALTGLWEIGQYTVTVASTTRLDGPFAVGQLVEVRFRRTLNGELIATRIQVKRNAGDRRREARTFGIIQDRPVSPTVTGGWVINSNTYSVTNTTVLTGPLEIGNCSMVRYHMDRATRERIASRIRGLNTTDCSELGRVISRTYGFVDSMPAQGYIGTWVIGGVRFEMDAQTKFEEEHGAFAAGSYVKVKFRVVNGVNQALEVESKVAPQSGDTDLTGEMTGTLQIASASADRTITVAGQMFIITEETIVTEDLGALAPGAKVYVNAYTDATGRKVATVVSVIGAYSYVPVARR
jgi:hypothetical protein